MPEVRRELLLLQRNLIEKSNAQFGGAVVEGRDIGTTVWPDAELKIYLTADVEARATRRQAQLSELSEVSASSVADSLAKRDAIDSMRAASPLRQSEDQIVLDATYLNLEETIQALWNLIEERKING
jgi:GTP-binding protein